METLLSICVPTFERPTFLKRNILSVLGQISPQVELIVSDDSLSDETEKLVEELNRKYEGRIRYNKNQHNPNILAECKQAHNVNKLISLAKGKFVHILHDDDFLIDGGLEKILEELKKNGQEHSVFLFGVNLVDENGSIQKVQSIPDSLVYSSEEAVRKLMVNSAFVRTPSVIIKKEVYEHIGNYDPDRKLPLDFDMWARIFPYYSIYHSSKLVANYTRHTNNLTMSDFNEEYLRIRLDIFNKLREKNIFKPSTFAKYESLFLHQWILAGVYKNLKVKRFKNAKSVYGLFKLDEIRKLPIALKWLPLKITFGLFLMFIR
ncbi:MAG: glycosyltransferase [Leptolyngbya sp. SIO1D8]|nr:glycosyltransferase [Leptolyngbya sp. SIO1D8]